MFLSDLDGGRWPSVSPQAQRTPVRYRTPSIREGLVRIILWNIWSSFTPIACNCSKLSGCWQARFDSEIWYRPEFWTWSFKLGIHAPLVFAFGAVLDIETFLVLLRSVDHSGALIPDKDSDNLSKNFKTSIKEVGRLRIGKILRKNRWMSDEEKMIYLQFYNEIEFWSINTVSNEIKWYYIIIDILEV